MQDSIDKENQRPLNWKDIPELADLAEDVSRFAPSSTFTFRAVLPDGTLDGEPADDQTFELIRRTITKHSQDLLLARIIANLYICGNEDGELDRSRHAEGLREIIELAAAVPPRAVATKESAGPLSLRVPGLKLKAVDYVLERYWTFGAASYFLEAARNSSGSDRTTYIATATNAIFGEQGAQYQEVRDSQLVLYDLFRTFNDQLSVAVPMHPAAFAVALAELRDAANEVYGTYSNMAIPLGLMVKGRLSPVPKEHDRGACVFFLKHRFGKPHSQCATILRRDEENPDQALRRVSADLSKFRKSVLSKWEADIPEWRILGNVNRLNELPHLFSMLI